MTTGLYEKYRVERTDGKPLTGPVFVLQPETDRHAVFALRAYLTSLEGYGDPNDLPLIADLREWIKELDRARAALWKETADEQP